MFVTGYFGFTRVKDNAEDPEIVFESAEVPEIVFKSDELCHLARFEPLFEFL